MYGVKKMFPREKQFADLLDKQNRKWQYPASRFKINDTHYRPDFYLPNENLYIEVVGSRQAYHANKKKIAKFLHLYPHIKFTIVDYENIPYPYLKKSEKFFPNLKIIPYFNSFIIMYPPHRSGKCGVKNWNPKICPTCKTINWYRRNKRFNSKQSLLDFLRAKKIMEK